MTLPSTRILCSAAAICCALATTACDAVRDGAPSAVGGAIAGSALRIGTDSIALSLVRRIGQLDGPPEYAFGRIAAIETTRDGGFYLCDGNDVSIRRYDSAGVFVRTLGRKGAGPGEYVACADMSLDPQDGLALSDPANGRVTFFRPDGSLDRSVTVHVAPGFFGSENVFFVDPAGRMWLRGWQAVEGTNEATRPHQYVVLDAAGTRLDSVAVPMPGEGPGRGFMLCTNDGCYVAQPQDTLSVIARNGLLAVASPMAYRIALHARDGTTREIARAAEPVAYTRAEHAEWEAWRAYMTKRTPQYPPIAIPTIKPIIRELRFDDVGRLWVKVHVTAERRPIPPRPAGDPRPLLTWRERNTYDLFDVASGGYIGRVAFPYATTLLTSRGDRVWLSEEGESGEIVLGIHEMRSARTP